MAKKNYDVLVYITVARHMRVEGMESEEEAERYAQDGRPTNPPTAPGNPTCSSSRRW